MKPKFSHVFWPTIISLIFCFVLLEMYWYQQQQIDALRQQVLLSNRPVPTAIAPTTIPTQLPTLAKTITTTSTPTSAPKLVKAVISDTSTWATQTCGKISFKVPPQVKSNCTDNGTNIAFAKEGDYFGMATIRIGTYDGGSRRQWWIKNMNTSDTVIQKYVRFEDTLYGSVNGLAVYADGGWWQGGWVSPILIASNKTLVQVYGGNNFDQPNNKIVRDAWQAALASTIKFLDN